MHKLAVDVTFTLMTAKKGIKKHVERSVAAMYKEYKQLEYLKAMGALNPDSIIILHKKGTPRAINLIKEKRSGKLKGRMCVYGQPQRCYITKEDASSPTISMEDLFNILVIDVHEGRDVESFDVPRAYLNSDTTEDKFILLKIEGEFVDIMCKVNPKHNRHVCVDNGLKVLYLSLLKSLYGFMESVLLWYFIYSKTLKSQESLINPYDKCIANSTIKDKQCTIVWYVDDNKVSHVDEEVNTKVFETISEHFGNLTVSRGKKHKFLGMEI